MEITVDKRSKTCMRYDEEDIQEMYNLLSQIPDIKMLKKIPKTYSKGNAQTNYLGFKLNGQCYYIRMSDHSRETESNAFFLGIEFSLWFKIWYIDASTGLYKPNDVTTIVQNIDAGIQKYKSDKGNEKLTSFVTEVLDNMPSYESETLYESDILGIAEEYMDKEHIKDDKYGTQLHAIYYSAFFIAYKWNRKQYE